MSDPRLGVDLHTGRGDDEYYDQVMGMSQKIINSSFGKLYDKYDELKSIDVKFRDGTIKGDLNAPKITMPLKEGKLDQSKVYHHISFKSGTMKSNNGFELDMAEWIIIIECDMDQQAVNQEPKEDETLAQKNARERFKESFSVPGDYRIERLYVKLTSANWNKVDGNSRVVNPRTGKKCSMEEWQADVDDYNDRNEVPDDSVDDFLTMMRNWTRDLERKSLTTLGIRLTKPHVDDSPTFIPTSIIHETYPYRDPSGSSDEDVLTGGDHNCFLYMENVGDRPGPPRLLEWSANLAYPTTGSFPEVTGSFVLSRELFMDRFLVPQLQGINKGTTININTANLGEGGHSYPNSFDQGYTDSTPATDPKFAFKLLPDKKGFQYNLKLDKSNGPVKLSDRYESAVHISETTVTLRWVPGDHKFQISGSLHYVREYYAASSGTPSKQNNYAFTQEDYKWPWSYDVNIDQTDGTLIMTFPEDVNSGTSDVTIDGTPGYIDDAVDKKNNGLDKKFKPLITSTLSGLNRQLNANFQRAGKFVYPGTGQLNFSGPKFSTSGCLFCDVDWKPLGDGEIIKVDD